MQGSGVYTVAAWPGAALTGIWRKMDFFKPMAVIMNILVRFIGMSARNGSKPLAYACLAPQPELEGMIQMMQSAMMPVALYFCNLLYACLAPKSVLESKVQITAMVATLLQCTYVCLAFQSQLVGRVQVLPIMAVAVLVFMQCVLPC